MATYEDVATKGEAIYAARLKAILEPAQNGKFVAIEVVSGDYFLGDTLLEAGEKASGKYPNHVFYFVKVSSPVVWRRRS